MKPHPYTIVYGHRSPESAPTIKAARKLVRLELGGRPWTRTEPWGIICFRNEAEWQRGLNPFANILPHGVPAPSGAIPQCVAVPRESAPEAPAAPAFTAADWAERMRRVGEGRP